MRATNVATNPPRVARLQFAVVLLVGLCLAGPSPAALLGVDVDTSQPFIFYNSDGVLRYKAVSGLLTIDATPLVLSDGAGNLVFFEGGSLSIAVTVDNTGALVGGDLTLSGTVSLPTTLGGGTFTGDLLFADVNAFGFNDSGTSTDQYDFRFTPTGGLLQGRFTDSLVVELTSEQSNFVGDFTVEFGGEAKGNLGSELECEVEIEKTCCIPPPPPPPAGKCEGKLQEFTMIWDGAGAIGVSGVANDAPGGVVNPGDTVSFFGPFSDNDVVVTIDGRDESVFHVSCSDKDMDGDTATNEDQGQVSPLGRDCGKFQGNGKGSSGVNEWLLEGFVDKNNDVLDCTPPDPDPSGETACRPIGGSTGDDCRGKVLEMVFEYTGADCEVPLGNPQDGKAKCEGTTGGATAAIVPDKSSIKADPSLVGVGDVFTIRQKEGKELKASTKLEVVGSGTQKLTIHTSCSKDLNVGDVFGSLKLVELTTTEGGTVTDDVTPVEFLDECELPEAPAGDVCDTKVLGLTLRYLGGDCTVVTDQDPGKAECTGDTLAGDVSITITKDKVFADPSTGIADGELFTIRKIGKGGVKELGSETKFDASDGSGTQSIKYHTSCSQTIQLGDRLGAFEVFALDLKDDEPVSLGGTVEYQYTISNPGAAPLTVTSVFDDQLMELLAPDTIGLLPTESVTLFETRTLSETTTNEATVIATTDGQECMDTDQVTVEIIPPPPEAFNCAATPSRSRRSR